MKTQGVARPRVASKVTDRLTAVLDYVERTKPKKFTLTWDRIDDPDADESGVIVVPILIVEQT